METLDQLFSKLDGPAGVGRLIGKTTEHASSMRRRRSIPVRYWSKLIQGAREKGLDIDEATLVALHSIEIAA